MTTERIVGHVVHYAGERDSGAYVINLGAPWAHTAMAMMKARPDATICIEPVTQIPEWVK